MDIIWKPGQGVDLQAVERMKQHFRKPTERSYAAWFMSGEITYIDWLTDLPFEQYDIDELENYLFDTCAGIKNFDRYEEWVNWYLYLLPQISLKVTEGNLLCLTLTYFFNVYPNEIIEEYSGFRDDVLKVLPFYIMSQDLYENGDLAITYPIYEELNEWFEDGGKWSNALAATMFFCLKYLKPQEISTWVESLATMKAPLLKSEIEIWIARAKRFIQYVMHSELVPRDSDILKKLNDEGLHGYLDVAGINWWHSLLIFKNPKMGTPISSQLNSYLPQENINAFLTAVSKYEL